MHQEDAFKDFVNRGNLYITKNNLTHFRESSANGSITHFLLSKNDIIAVTQVSGNRLFGLVEVFWSDEKSEMIQGWVREQDVIYAGNYFMLPQDDLELAKQ